jgi:hypothetical protein
MSACRLFPCARGVPIRFELRMGTPMNVQAFFQRLWRPDRCKASVRAGSATTISRQPEPRPSSRRGRSTGKASTRLTGTFLSRSHDLLDLLKVWWGRTSGLAAVAWTAAYGAQRKLMFEVGCFRFCAGFRIPAPLMIYPPVLRGRCPKAFREGTRGVWRAACRLWGFDGAAAWVRVALAGVVDGRSTIAIDNFSPPLPSSR